MDAIFSNFKISVYSSYDLYHHFTDLFFIHCMVVYERAEVGVSLVEIVLLLVGTR